ncbi:hypothetical protein OIX85_003896 [Vibrio parahaemolyticus]|nr:hypothetical protein [Vibrio parahaemolyticus]
MTKKETATFNPKDREQVKDALTALFKNMFTSLENDAKEAYQNAKDNEEVKAATEAFVKRDLETAFAELFTDTQRIGAGMVFLSDAKDKRRLEHFFQHYPTFEAHFRHLFERFEGSACCVDKARTCLKAITNFLMVGTPIEFKYDAAVTYHLPQIILTTHDEVMTYFDTVMQITVGRFEGYIENLGRLSEILEAKRNEAKEAPIH